MPKYPSEFNFDNFMAEFALEEARELEQLQQAVNASNALMQNVEQVDNSGALPTFEQQFAEDLELDREIEQAYLRAVPSSEVANSQFEQAIRDGKLLTFEQQFARDLELDRNIESTYFANILGTEQALAQFEQVTRTALPPTFEQQFAKDLELDRNIESTYFASILGTEQALAQFEEVTRTALPPTFEQQFAKDLELDREVEQAYLRAMPSSELASAQFEQVIQDGKLPTFEQQFAKYLELDRKIEQAYLRAVPSSELANAQFEQVIQDGKLPTFEQQFAKDLELDRQAEKAWMDSISTPKEIEDLFEEIIKRSRKWHDLARAAGANILLHIVDFNYSEQNYRQLLDAPEFADDKYIPIRTPDDLRLLGIFLDFGSPNVVKLNLANAFIDLAQTKRFTLETPHGVSIDELHVKSLTIKQFLQIDSPKSIITLADFIDLMAKGPIVVGSVTATNKIEFYSPNKIEALMLKAASCELHSLSAIKIQKLLAQQLLKARAPNLDIKQAISLDKLYFKSESLVAHKIVAQLVSLKSKKIAVEQIIGAQLVKIKAHELKAKLIASQTKGFELEKESTPSAKVLTQLPDPAPLYHRLQQHYKATKQELAAEFKYAIVSGEFSGFSGSILEQLSISEAQAKLAAATKETLKTLHQLVKPYLAVITDKLVIDIDELASAGLEFINLWVAGDIPAALNALQQLIPNNKQAPHAKPSSQNKAAGSLKVDCQERFEVDRIQAKDCYLKVSDFVYKNHTFEGITNNLTLEFKNSYILNQRLNANQIRLIHLCVNYPLILDDVLDIQNELIIDAMALQQNKTIKAGSAQFNIRHRFDNNAPITAKDITIKALRMQQSQAGNIQGKLLDIHVSDGDFQGNCRVKKLKLSAKDSLQYVESKWQADNYDIKVPEPGYAKLPSIVAGDYALTITNPIASDVLSIPHMQLGGQLTINANQCNIEIVRANKIVARFIIINGERIRLSESGLFATHGITLSAVNGFTGLNDGAYIRTVQGDIQLISMGNQIDLSYVEILAMLSGNIVLRAKDGVRTIAGRLQTVNGDVIVQSPNFLMGLIYQQLQSESRGHNLTRTGGVKVTSRAAELVARRLLLSGFNPGQRCVARLIGSMCYLQELPINREAIQTQSITDHENFNHTWTYDVEVGRSSRRHLGVAGPRDPIIETRQGRKNTTTTHATYTAELVTHNDAHVNLTPEDHSGLILSAGQTTIRFDAGTVFNPTPQATNHGPFLNVGLDEVVNLPSSGGFYTFVPKLSAADFAVPGLGNRYSFYVPAVEIPYEEKYPMIAGLDRHGKIQIMPRGRVWMYHHLGQELENFHLILHKQYAASLSIMPNPEMLYWKACHNGANAINALQDDYADDSITLETLESDLIAGDQYVVFYQEQLEPITSQYAWFMRAIMPQAMYQQLTKNFGASGVYGENILLCGVDSGSSIKLRDSLKAKALLDMKTGHVEFSKNKVKAQNITADLNSLNIDDAEVEASIDVYIAAEFLSITRSTAAKTNLRAGNDIGLKAAQFVGSAASINAGHDLTTLFVQSADNANPLQTSDGSVIHLLPKLVAGNAILWQVAQQSIHEAPQIKARKFKEVAGESIYLAVKDVHHKTWSTQESGGWGPFKKKKDVQHVTIDVISRGAQFDVEETVEIVANAGIRLQQVQSFAGQNTFVAADATVELLAGTNSHQSQTQSYKRNLVWQKHQCDTINSKNHTPCKFSGNMKIIARSAYIELLANNLESQKLKGQVEEGLEGELLVQYLYAAYEHHCKKQQGPTAAAAALIAIGIAVLTYGTGSALLGAGATATNTAAAASTASTAAMSSSAMAASMIDVALCSSLTTITLSLANNGGDIGKAVKALGKSENIRGLLTSIATAGIAAKFIEPLKQSKNALDAVLKVEQTANLLTKIGHSLTKAGVQFSMSQLIEKGEHRSKFVSALGSAVTGAVAEHLDFGISTKQLNQQISTIEAKVSTALVGGLSASVIGGKRAFLGGSLGALIADADVLAMNETDLNPQDIGKHARACELLTGFAALLSRQDVSSAAMAASRVAENRAYTRVLQNKLQDIAPAEVEDKAGLESATAANLVRATPALAQQAAATGQAEDILLEQLQDLLGDNIDEAIARELIQHNISAFTEYGHGDLNIGIEAYGNKLIQDSIQSRHQENLRNNDYYSTIENTRQSVYADLEVIARQSRGDYNKLAYLLAHGPEAEVRPAAFAAALPLALVSPVALPTALTLGVLIGVYALATAIKTDYTKKSPPPKARGNFEREESLITPFLSLSSLTMNALINKYVAQDNIIPPEEHDSTAGQPKLPNRTELIPPEHEWLNNLINPGRTGKPQDTGILPGKSLSGDGVYAGPLITPIPVITPMLFMFKEKQASEEVKFKRWARGDAIDKPLPDGTDPTWDSVRARYWKHRCEESKNTGEFEDKDLKRMERGLAPQDYNPRTGEYESRELHHVIPQQYQGANSPANLRELTPDQHAEVDPYRQVKGISTKRGIE